MIELPFARSVRADSGEYDPVLVAGLVVVVGTTITLSAEAFTALPAPLPTVALPGLILATLLLAIHVRTLATYLLAFSTTITPEIPIPGFGIPGLTVNLDLILVPALLLAFVATKIRHEDSITLKDFDLAVVGFASVAILSLLLEWPALADSMLLSMLFLAEWVAYCSIPLLLRNVLVTRRRTRLFVAALFVAAGFLVVHLLLRRLVFGVPRQARGRGTAIDPFTQDKIQRLRPFWKQNSNAAGAYMALFITMGTAVFVRLRKELQPFLGLFLGGGIVVLFYTFSRSAYLSMLIGVGVVCVWRRPATTVVAGVLSFVFSVIVIPQEYFYRVYNIFRPSSYVNLPIGGLDGRLVGWIIQIDLFAREPLFGTGFHLVKHTVGLMTGNRMVPDSAHLQTLVGTGIVGYTLYLLIFIFAARHAYNVVRWNDDPLFRGLGIGLIGSIIGFMAGSMFYDIFGRWRLLGPLFCFIGVVIAISVNLTERPDQSDAAESD